MVFLLLLTSSFGTMFRGKRYLSPARNNGGHVWMFWKTHQELVANSPRWAKARELHRDWADVFLWVDLGAVAKRKMTALDS